MDAGRFPQSPPTPKRPVCMRAKESQPVATGWGLPAVVCGRRSHRPWWRDVSRRAVNAPRRWLENGGPGERGRIIAIALAQLTATRRFDHHGDILELDVATMTLSLLWDK